MTQNPNVIVLNLVSRRKNQNKNYGDIQENSREIFRLHRHRDYTQDFWDFPEHDLAALMLNPQRVPGIFCRG